jgi:hypothetical protein
MKNINLFKSLFITEINKNNMYQNINIGSCTEQ